MWWSNSIFSSLMVDSIVLLLFVAAGCSFPRWKATYTQQSLCWKKSAWSATFAGMKVNMKDACSLKGCQLLWPNPTHPDVVEQLNFFEFDGGLDCFAPLCGSRLQLSKMESHLHSTESLLEKERMECHICRNES